MSKHLKRERSTQCGILDVGNSAFSSYAVSESYSSGTPKVLGELPFIERSRWGRLWKPVDTDVAVLDLMSRHEDYEVAMNDLREGYMLQGATSGYLYRLAR